MSTLLVCLALCGGWSRKRRLLEGSDLDRLEGADLSIHVQWAQLAASAWSPASHAALSVGPRGELARHARMDWMKRGIVHSVRYAVAAVVR